MVGTGNSASSPFAARCSREVLAEVERPHPGGGLVDVTGGEPIFQYENAFR